MQAYPHSASVKERKGGRSIFELFEKGGGKESTILHLGRNKENRLAPQLWGEREKEGGGSERKGGVSIVGENQEREERASVFLTEGQR